MILDTLTIIAIFSSLMASVLSIVAIKTLNDQFTNLFDLEIVLLYVNLLSIVVIFVVSIIVVFLSSFIPIKRITIMKPINAIKHSLY